MKTERELGAVSAHIVTLRDGQASIRQELREGLDRIDRNVATQVQHVRGEVMRLEEFMTKDRSELRAILTHNQEIIRDDVTKQIRDADRERNKDRLWLLLAAGAIAAGGAKGLEYLMAIGGG